MGILYDTLIQMNERSMQTTRPVVGEPMWNGQRATQTDVLAWDNQHKQDATAAVQPEVPPKPVRDVPPGSQIAWEKQYGLKYDVQGRDKAKVLAAGQQKEAPTLPDSSKQVAQNNQQVQPGVANKDAKPDSSQQQQQQQQQQPQTQPLVSPSLIMQLQQAIVDKGGLTAQMLGKTGPKKNGVDGVIGKNTIGALLQILKGVPNSTPASKTDTPGADSVIGAQSVQNGPNANIDQATRDTAVNGAPQPRPIVDQNGKPVETGQIPDYVLQGKEKPGMTTEGVGYSQDPTLARIIQLAR